MKYTNEKCDGCGLDFREGDDIVVCPECGTPQHRACYDRQKECVNAEKHSSGFEWHASAHRTDAPKERTSEQTPQELICPSCGHSNPAGSTQCENCGQRFTVFGFNVVEKQMELKNDEERDASGGDDGGQTEFDVDRLINLRVSALAPGITAEQKREPLCGHTIAETIAFVGNNASSYVGKFRKIEREGRHTFNWGAFFFWPMWFFFRKLFKPGIIFLTIHFGLTILMFNPYDALETFLNSFNADMLNSMTSAQMNEFIHSYVSLAMPIMIIGFLRLVVGIVCGFLGDRLYHKYCEQSLNEIEEARSNADIDVTTLFLKRSSTSFLFVLASWILCSFVPSLIMMLFN